MVGQELQARHVSAGGDGRRQHVAREGAEDGRLGLAAIFDRHEVELLLHAEVVEGQVDAALGLGDDEPHAVHVVAVLLRVVGRQEHARRTREVEETGDWSRAGWREGHTPSEKTLYSAIAHVLHTAWGNMCTHSSIDQ